MGRSSAHTARKREHKPNLPHEHACVVLLPFALPFTTPHTVCLADALRLHELCQIHMAGSDSLSVDVEERVTTCKPLEIVGKAEILVHENGKATFMCSGLVVLGVCLRLRIALARVTVQPVVDRPNVREGWNAELASRYMLSMCVGSSRYGTHLTKRPPRTS